MANAQPIIHENEIAFEAFGVRTAFSASRPELVELMRPILPPDWKPCEPSMVTRRYTLIAEEFGTYSFQVDDVLVNRRLELELALMLIDSQLRLHLGVEAPDAIFVHAGVVAHRGRTIVIPGKTFEGKTTLVAALVRAGGTYFSDEFAVIDEQGLVHPYAKPLSVRGPGEIMQTDHSLDSLGWTPGSEALPIGVIVATRYRPDAKWRPRRLSSGETAMALLTNAVPAQDRPAQVMRVVSRAAEDSLVAIESERGEAAEVAPLLLAELERLPA